ncbi:MAG: carbohydrate-binding domain-containing protein [Lachnospiraceae bacterium]|nr:carbohydrate-binding domain-containing protein [Lachnospiraceae bacterium]
MKKKVITIAAALMLSASLAACGAANNNNTNTDTQIASQEQQVTTIENTNAEDTAATEYTAEATIVNVSTDGAIDTSDLFTERDLTQTADLSEAVYLTLEDSSDIEINGAGVYVISGEAQNSTIIVEAGDEDKVQIVLDGASITNTDFPCIYVKNADKVFVTTAEGTVNNLTVTGTFTADDTTNTDAVIFSKDDLVLNGLGTLNITSSDNGVAGKDDLKVTGGTINITCEDCAFEANDSICVADGTINIQSVNDGLHAEYDEDDSVGFIYICGGTININSDDDGIHATTICQIDGGTIVIDAAEAIEATQVQINDGTVDIKATDDGINGSQKSSAYTIFVEINGGDISIDMGQGDTDAIDSNGDLYINGGTLNITAQSAFDYDGTGQYNGGTIYVNGTQVNTLSNQMMGGMPGGDMGGQPGGQPGGVPGGRP